MSHIGCDNDGTVASDRCGFTARRSTHVEHELACCALDSRRNPLRRLVLHVAISTRRDRWRLVHLQHRVNSLITELSRQTIGQPVRIAQPRSLRWPGHLVDRVVGDSPQHCVDETAGLAGCQVDRCAHSSVSRNTRIGELISAEPENGTGFVIGRLADKPVDDCIACSAHPRGAVDEFGCESTVLVCQIRRGERRAEHQIRVGPIVFNPLQDVECQLPGIGVPRGDFVVLESPRGASWLVLGVATCLRISSTLVVPVFVLQCSTPLFTVQWLRRVSGRPCRCVPVAHSAPNNSSSLGWAPLRHAANSIGPFPSGCTVTGANFPSTRSAA